MVSYRHFLRHFGQIIHSEGWAVDISTVAGASPVIHLLILSPHSESDI